MPVNRTEVFEALGGKCTDCGTTDTSVLEVHYAPGNTEHYGINTYRKYRAALRNPDGFLLRCGPCRVKRSSERLMGLSRGKMEDALKASGVDPDDIFEGELSEE